MAANKFEPWETSGGRCNCTALRKATRRISQLYDATLGAYGLKTTQRAILAHIGRSEPTTVGSLAEALIMDAGALAHTLKPLERDSLVSIEVDPRDRRNRLIRLTPDGRAKLIETNDAWVRAQARFEAALGQVESDQLRAALHFLISDEFATAFEKQASQPAKTLGT